MSPCGPAGSCLCGLPEKAGTGRPELLPARGAPAAPTASPALCLEQSAHGSDRTHLRVSHPGRRGEDGGGSTATSGPIPQISVLSQAGLPVTFPMTQVKQMPGNEASALLAKEGPSHTQRDLSLPAAHVAQAFSGSRES